MPTRTATATITIQLTLSRDDELEVVVEDDGPGFDEQSVGEWHAEELGEDGMGLAIIQAVADDVEIGAA